MSNDDLGDFSMLELFREEAETQLAALSNGLVALESAEDRKPILDELMRAAHSMKGAARIIGLDSMVKIAHAVEDIFVAALRGELAIEAPQVDVLLSTVDFVNALARGETDDSATGEVEIPSRLAALTLVREGRLEVAPRAEVPPPASLVSQETPAITPAGPSIVADPTPPASLVANVTASSPPMPAARMPEKSIRMTAEAIERLTGLTAETVVEATRLEHLMDDFGTLRERQRELHVLLSGLRRLWDERTDLSLVKDNLEAAFTCLDQCNRLLGERDEKLEQYARRSSNLATRLSRETLSSRMMPFGSILRGYPRLVRDLARDLDKSCRLEIRGESTKIDREILERLDAPLNHLVRNALDHGLEATAQRVANGKSPEGRLMVEAYHRSGQLRVLVSDDGDGIDVNKLRAKVVERQLESAERAANLSEDELFEFLFLPSFSTASAITEISGRGVGLDAVRTMVQEARGAIRIRSQPGKGTTFDIELPITRSVVRALLVRIAGEQYAIPIPRIERVLSLSTDVLHSVEGRPYFAFDGADIALVPAVEILELALPEWTATEFSVVVMKENEQIYGLIVDAFVGERDLVVRPLDPRLGALPDIASVATDEAGAIVLILDVDELVRAIDGMITGGHLRRPAARAKDLKQNAVKRILVVDDSLTVRQAERQLLENHGYLVDVAVDGVEGWSAVRLNPYHLVVTDVDMPRMNGIELVRKIRTEGRLHSLPVVIVSYKDREEDRLLGLEAGANHYLAKGGFRDTALLDIVMDLIGPPTD